MLTGLVLAAVLTAGCGSTTPGRAPSARVDPCSGAGFVGGRERADGLFAARIPAGCALDGTRSCTVADGHGPIAREIVPAGIRLDCFAFNQYVGSGLSTVVGYSAGECFGRALLHGVPAGVARVDRPTFRCDGGRAPRANAGTRMPVVAPARGPRIIEGRAPDPWGRPPQAVLNVALEAPAPPRWGVRLWHDRAGRTCVEPGQIIDEHTPGRSDQLPGVHSVGRLRRATMLGVLRYDSHSGPGVQLYGSGRFTEYPIDIGGSCGTLRGPGDVVLSWESRYARRDLAFATTAISGIAGPAVGGVQARVRGRWRSLPLTRHRAFILAVRGIAGPAQVPVRVRDRGGRTRTYAAGLTGS